MKERYWTFIMYEDSRPKNWKEILQETGVQIAISPYHDKDLNADETQKKPHYHVLMCFNGPTTYKRVTSITEQLNATIPKRVMSCIGLIRYFTHKDNPEKAQYNEEDITTINGLDIKEIDGLTTTKVESLKREIILLIRRLDIREYAECYNYLEDNQLREMQEVFSKNTIFFNAYIKSSKGLKIEKENDNMNIIERRIENAKRTSSRKSK